MRSIGWFSNIPLASSAEEQVALTVEKVQFADVVGNAFDGDLFVVYDEAFQGLLFRRVFHLLYFNAK